MTEQEYIEELANIIDPNAFLLKLNERKYVAKNKARAIADYHREQGLLVVPYESLQNINYKFMSGNSVPVERAIIKSYEWEPIRQAMLDAAKGESDD